MLFLLSCYCVSSLALGVAPKPKPEEREGAAQPARDTWVAWNPEKDPHQESPIDLRRLNEEEAGMNGRIVVRDGHFARESDGVAVRFWAVNGPHAELRGEDLRHALRDLAKRGVNMVRLHGAVFDRSTGEVKPERIAFIQEVVSAAKPLGIYTHLSIYFPLWFEPRPDNPFLAGYSGSAKPFASLYFNRAFEAKYQSWWEALLTSENPHGPVLVDDPAVFGAELVNEDSFFFWTFNNSNLPEPQLLMLESRFADWAEDRYGGLGATYEAWDGLAMPRDDLEQERLAFRPLYDLFSQKTQRDLDTTLFLAEVQRSFYERQVLFLRNLGFKGLITASNWHTANDRVFKPVEIWTYLAGDFIDRHGYFGTDASGENVAWSIRPDHVYADRSALRFDARKPTEPKHFGHPVVDPEYNGLPSMISETTWTRPNRYRTEAPLFLAAYGSLQDSDCIVHFAHDGAEWSVKPRYWMQPWTLMSPSQMGQFPAAALIFRQSLIRPGATMAHVGLDLEEDVFGLKGTPLVQEGMLDELRKEEEVTAEGIYVSKSIDPRIYYVGQTKVTIASDPPPTEVADLEPYIDDEAQTIRSETGELHLHYGPGVLAVRGEKAQALSGDLAAAGQTDLGVLQVDSPLDLGHVILVPLDEQPLAESKSMLLQVMTEEKNTGWETEPVDEHRYRVLDIGRNPWLFRSPRGAVRIQRRDAEKLRVTALDLNGYRQKEIGSAERIELLPDVVYYLIEKR